MELMEDKDKHMETESKNRKKLLEEVETLVVSGCSCCLFKSDLIANNKDQFESSQKCCPRPAASRSIFNSEVTVFHYTDRP